MSNERYSTQSEFGHVTCNVFKEKSGHRGVFPFFWTGELQVVENSARQLA